MLIIGYNDAAKLIAYYHRTYVQDKLPEWLDPVRWEDWIGSHPAPIEVGPRYLSVIGNLGLTLLATAPAYFSLAKPFDIKLSVPLCIMLILLNLYDIYLHFRSTRSDLRAD